MSRFSAKIDDHIIVRDGKLLLNGRQFYAYEITEELGRGANGVAFRAKNTLLNRDEALKVWFAARDGDNRCAEEFGVRLRRTPSRPTNPANSSHAVTGSDTAVMLPLPTNCPKVSRQIL